MSPKTTKHYEVLKALIDFLKKNRYAPSMRELMELTGIRSLSHVRYCLKRLSDEGLIAYEQGKSRTVRVIGKPGLSGTMGMDGRRRNRESTAKKKQSAGKAVRDTAFTPVLRKDREARLQERIEMVVQAALQAKAQGPNQNVMDERVLRFSGSKIG